MNFLTALFNLPRRIEEILAALTNRLAENDRRNMAVAQEILEALEAVSQKISPKPRINLPR